MRVNVSSKVLPLVYRLFNSFFLSHGIDDPKPTHSRRLSFHDLNDHFGTKTMIVIETKLIKWSENKLKFKNITNKVDINVKRYH